MESQPASAKTTRRDQKLSGILAAAAAVFAEEGYDRASIRMVSERAGVSVPGLYHYVRSKEELLYLIQLHVFSELVQAYKEQSQGVRDPQERLRLLVRNQLKRFLGNMAELVVCSREIGRLQGDLRVGIETKQREYFALLRNVFADLAEHHGGSSVEPRTAALALFGTINWIHTWYRPKSGPSANRMADEFIRLYLGGFLPGPAGTRGKGDRDV